MTKITTPFPDLPNLVKGNEETEAGAGAVVEPIPLNLGEEIQILRFESAILQYYEKIEGSWRETDADSCNLKHS